MSLFKKLSLLFIASFVILLFGVVSVNNINAQTLNQAPANACADPKLTLAGKEGNVYTIKIKNPCNSEHNYQLKVNPPGGANSGWKAKISGNNVNNNDVIKVKKNDTAQFKVKIDLPNNPSAGTHTTIVSATQKDGNSKNKDTIKLNYG